MGTTGAAATVLGMTTETLPGGVLPSDRRPPPVLDVVVPVYNEQDDLGPCVRRLHAHLTAQLPYAFRITVADNASTDSTSASRDRLAEELAGVDVVHLDEKGRGRALRARGPSPTPRSLAYMDVDLSTDLAALLPLVAPLVSGHTDVAIGSRLARGARVVRGTEARGHLPRLQPDAARDPRRAVLRCAVRFQGHPPRGRRAPAPAGRGRRVVLRHRAARAGRAHRPAHPRGPRRLGGRPRQQRRCRRHRARRPPWQSPGSAGPGHRRAPPRRVRGPARPGTPRAGDRGCAAGHDPSARAVRGGRRRRAPSPTSCCSWCSASPSARSGPTSSRCSSRRSRTPPRTAA